MVRKRNQSFPLSIKWTTHNQQHPCKRKISLQTEFYTTQFAKKYRNPWIWSFVGFKIKSNKTISMSSGNQAKKTWETFLPNITRCTTTDKYFQCTSMQRLPHRELLLRVFSLITDTAKLGNYNKISIHKHDGTGTPKSQAT